MIRFLTLKKLFLKTILVFSMDKIFQLALTSFFISLHMPVNFFINLADMMCMVSRSIMQVKKTVPAELQRKLLIQSWSIFLAKNDYKIALLIGKLNKMNFILHLFEVVVIQVIMKLFLIALQILLPSRT